MRFDVLINKRYEVKLRPLQARRSKEGQSNILLIIFVLNTPSFIQQSDTC